MGITRAALEWEGWETKGAKQIINQLAESIENWCQICLGFLSYTIGKEQNSKSW